MAVTIDHSGKAVLVTGAGAGIGREIARWFARAGAERGGQRPRRGASRGGGQRAAPLRGDGGGRARGLPRRREVEAMVAATVARFGGLDVAVNNIGMLPPGRGLAPFVEMDGGYWRDLLDQNLVLAALCAAAEARADARAGPRGRDPVRQLGRDDAPVTPQRRLRRREGRGQPPHHDRSPSSSARRASACWPSPPAPR